MKVVGIDPGTAACGYGIVHESGGRLRAVDHGCWFTPPGERPELRLRTIFDGVAALVAAALAGVPCAEYPPSSVKQAVCGYGRAEKAQVQRMVKTILGLKAVPTPNHAADALAVAICHALAPPLLRIAG